MATTSKKEVTKKATTVSLDAAVFSQEGKAAGSVALPATLFDVPWNADLVKQVTLAMMSNARANTAKVKGRGEVRGGGKKPWRQKGTGRARHGSSRSPIWVGGGTTHGPTNERNYAQKINKKMRAKALAVVLSRKLRDGQIVFVENLSFSEPKTKTAKAVIDALAKSSNLPRLASKKQNAAVVALSKKSANTEKSFANIPAVSVEEVRNLNPVTLLSSTYLIIEDPRSSLQTIASRIK
jgi:large subunit ribosomal protein L4